jgi:hypothetical protein
MGAWGNGSYECDAVMDNCDGESKNLTEKQTNALLKKVKTTNYDPTEFFGTVLWHLVEGNSAISATNMRKAIAEAENALANSTYLETWKEPGKRRDTLKAELKLVKGLLAKMAVVPKVVKVKKLKAGQEVKFRFEVDLDVLTECGGIEGVNNLLDEAWHNKNGYDFTMTDIGYKIVGHKEDSLTLEACGVLESID